MSLRINTNISAMVALDNLDQTDLATQSSIQRLSTGLRINNGADDPAGMIIAQGMQSEIAAIGQALQNTQNATNMAKTADGALGELQKLLLDLRGLSVHAANSAVLDSASLQADQTQVQSILQSIDRIASDTEFGNKKLFDGTAGALANVTAGGQVSSMYASGPFGNSTLATGPVTVTQVTSATRAVVTLGKSFASAGAIVTTSGSVVVNGYSISTNGTESVQSLVAKINAVSGTTGVTATITGNGPVQVVLSNQNYGSHFNISYFDPSKLLNNATSASSSGRDAVYNVTAQTAGGVQSTLFTGGRSATDSGLKLTDANGNNIVLTEGGNATITGVATQIGQVTAGTVMFQVGPDSNQSVSFSLPDMFSRNLGTGAVSGKSLADIDLTTSTGATQAMQVIEAAVQQVSTVRGQIGSFQKNVLQSGQRFLEIANENLTASASTITDANMAQEMTQFTKLQILQQSGIAVLAQANQSPKSVLQLLQ